MAKQKKKIHNQLTHNYKVRNENRQLSSDNATMLLVGYFMGQGDDLATANNKVEQVSYEILKTHSWALNGYERGNLLCKTDLFASIDSIQTGGVYPWFTVGAADVLKGGLDQ